MFKLPVCPYCRTVYSYKDIRKNRNKKVIECYHCKNEFKKSNFKGYAVLALIICAAAVTVNLIILNMTAEFITSIIPIMIISVSAVIIFMILTPFFSDYKKIKGVKEKEIPSGKIDESDSAGKRKRSVKNRQRKNK